MAKTRDENELYALHWSTLKTLWNGCRAAVADAAVQADIDGLFPAGPDWSADAEGWYKLNYAEQCIGSHLTATQLAVEYQRRLDMAKGQDIASFAFYEAKAKMFASPPADGETLDERRAVYLSLLSAVQTHLVETRFRRRLRRETAGRLFRFGLGVIMITLLPLLVPVLIYLASLLFTKADGGGGSYQVISSQPGYCLLMVAAFGVLGAYFSRVMSFQQKLGTMSFEDVMNLFQWRMMVLRLPYGMIGAVMFYYVLRGGLVGGSAFPDLSNLTVDGPTSSFTILVPTVELAKLLIWSFLAGFSERLVPDTLEQTEARAAKASGQ